MLMIIILYLAVGITLTAASYNKEAIANEKIGMVIAAALLLIVAWPYFLLNSHASDWKD